ncbi:MAG: MBL fold metallo-hydrolase [Methanosaeta sp. SDB]|nr:MAG: MBL fold metallo-hydrolase [Methanosaeta sp. SDB]
MKITGHEITDHIHALKIPFKIRDPSGFTVSRFVYIYIIYGEEICLVDGGVVSSERTIVDHLRETGRRPEEISRLILTHGHPDHIGAAKAIKGISGCSVASHSADKDWIEDIDQQERERPVPGFKDLVASSVRIDEILQDGDVLDLGDGLKLEVLHTPGHSPGSISLWMPQEGVLFSADAIPLDGAMPIYDDIVASVRSIQRLKAIEEIKVLLSAWDDPRFGEDAYRIMDEGLDYLQRIHGAVIKSAVASSQDPMELCRRTIRELGLPEMMTNPLTARSFQSSLKILDRRDLLRI